MKNMNRFVRTAAAFLAAAVLACTQANALGAGSVILMDGSTGQVLVEKSADKRSLIASTTKIMTALVVIEQCNVLDRVRIPKEAVGIEGSSMYLQEGEILTVQDLLYGLMLRSGNDAAVALAIYCGGTVQDFVERMNDKARVLGLQNTHFANPNGLDAPDHYSTARDLAVLTAYAMENPVFYKTVSTKSVRVGERTLQNHNKLLWRLPGADGVKTGYTKAAGRILVSSVTRGDRRLICVTINDGDDWNDHIALMEQGFRAYSLREIAAAGDVLGCLPVLGTGQTVELVARESFSCSLRQEEEVTLEYSLQGFVYPPVEPGQDAGVAYVLLGERVLGRIPLVYGQIKDKPFRFWDEKKGDGCGG